MARRRTRAKTRRSSPKTFNVASLLQSGMIASAVTQGFFNVNIGEFVMSTQSMSASQITARELISGLTGGSYGTMSAITQTGPYQRNPVGMAFGDQIKSNLSQNGAKMAVSLVLIPAGFKVFNKLTRQPRSMVNKALKMSALPLRV